MKGLRFLMYRVELKGLGAQRGISGDRRFLMYRVELKAVLTIG